ncbi:MAG: hypothetical protein EOP45_18750 [Sphingobacteriaceae bacterium]|nr:MAG: hypothetical protein EOP45_18750 [Sphingobacteriaceae bacterium]
MRNLLLAAGAAKVLFISLGKFGREYYKIDYQFQGNLFAPGYKFQRTGNIEHIDGVFNPLADGTLLDSLKGIV